MTAQAGSFAPPKAALDGASAHAAAGTFGAGPGADPVADLPDVDALPKQVAAASQFAPDAEGRIDLVPDPPSLEPLADATQRELFEEMRYKALALAGLGHNQLAELSIPVDRFRNALPEDFERVSINRIWSRGNTLRRHLKAHEIAVASGEPFDPAHLPPAVAETLRDLVDTFNVFIVGDRRGRELDQVRLGPQERQAAEAALKAAAPIVASVQASVGLATASAVEALTEQINSASDAAATVDGDQAVAVARNTTGNFIVETLRIAYGRARQRVTGEIAFGWKEARAGIYAAGSVESIAHYKEIFAFIVENVDSLKLFIEQVFNNPALIRIIDVIMTAAGRL